MCVCVCVCVCVCNVHYYRCCLSERFISAGTFLCASVNKPPDTLLAPQAYKQTNKQTTGVNININNVKYIVTDQCEY